MAQVTSGVRAILSHPVVYEAFQRFMGAKRGREWIVRDLIRPFPGMRILDLGCGPAEILDSLPQDVAYTGYDMSAEYIAAAKAKFGARGTFHCRLLEQAEVATLDPFDLVMGIGVLHHLDDGTARQFMTLAQAGLKPGGRVLTLDACYAPKQNPIARFIISRDRGQHVRSAAGYRALAEGIFTGITGAVTHRVWIPYTHWSMECSV
jgi:cyclopropane fatty-acyl-phospholipid synthase-like methyltransferase